MALKLDRWNSHKCTWKVYLTFACSPFPFLTFFPSLSPFLWKHSLLWQMDREFNASKSIRSIDPRWANWSGRETHCSAGYLKNKARLGTGLQHDTWFPMDLCKGQIPLQTIVRGRLWCCLVGSNFEESDEARKACRSPCLNLKYKFKEKLKAKWETWVYIQMWVVTSPTGTENKRELTEEIWDQVVKTRAKPLFQHKPVALPLESNALWNCKHYYLIAFSLFCLGTIYMNEKQLQK